jgi:Sensors of blue-light using FAD
MGGTRQGRRLYHYNIQERHMPHLMHCIYASAARRNFDTAELMELLQAARKHNDEAGLTGMLLYTEGSFFQVLEGAPGAVEALYSRIELDSRHEQVTRIVTEAIPSRSFAHWTMGFIQVSRYELALIPGTNDFFSGSSCFLGLDSGRAKKLLSAFREGRWRKPLAGAQTALS